MDGVVHQAVLQLHAGAVVDAVVDLVGGQAVGAEVQPEDVGALRLAHPDFRHPAVQEVDGGVDVGLHVVEHLLQPVVAVVVGGDQRADGEGGDGPHAEVLLEDAAQGGVGDDDRGAGQARHVERLVDAADHDQVGIIVRGGQHGGVAVALQDDVAVDLVGQHQHVVALADLVHALKLLRRPDAAHRVGRGAKHEQPVGGHGALLLEVRPVHGVVAVLADQLAVDHLAVALLLDAAGEVSVHRAAQDHAVAHVGERAHRVGHRLHRAVGEHQPVALERHAEAAAVPADDGIVILRHAGLEAVAVYAVVGHLVHLVDQRLRADQIHVRHIERQAQAWVFVIRLAVFVEQRSLAQIGGLAPLDAVAVDPVGDPVEIVCHGRPLLDVVWVYCGIAGRACQGGWAVL